MKVAHIKTTIDRHTGEVKQQEIVSYEEVDEDEYYRPLAEIFFERIMKDNDIRRRLEVRAAGCGEM
ncbi:MAG: hypothetical protein GX041_08490 [Clostridiales bacterium]|nr:hypothetical protein [Clostridiales bacterium]